MTRAVKATAVVQPGGVIRIASPDLDPGSRVEVIVLQADAPERPSIDEILAGYPGRRLFKTAAELDAYLRAERNSWAR